MHDDAVKEKHSDNSREINFQADIHKVFLERKEWRIKTLGYFLSKNSWQKEKKMAKRNKENYSKL